MEAALCTELDLAPSACSLYPPSTALLCSPTVICGQWRVGQVKTADDTGWGPVACSPLDLVVSATTPLVLVAVAATPLDLDPLVCEEA